MEQIKGSKNQINNDGKLTYQHMKIYARVGTTRFSAIVWIAILSITLFTCKKMDDTYSDLIKNGPLVYPGKADSVKTFAGNERLKLSFLLLSDPKINLAKIYWNNGKDSLLIPINRTSGIDEITTTLTAAQHGLAEGTYFFDIYTFDKYGNRSIKVQKLGNVYGTKYQSSLLTRAIQQVTRTNSTVVIDWYNAGEGFNGVELMYTTIGGEVKLLNIPATEMHTTSTDFKAGNTFSYRTIYLPEPKAIDQFYTSYTDVVVK